MQFDEWDDEDKLCAVAVARRVCGDEAARCLSRDFGGRRIFFPRTVTANHPLALSIGQEAAQKVCDEVHGCLIDVPVGENSPIHRRRQIIKLGVFAGISRSKLAAVAQCTERQVYNIISHLRGKGELPSSDRARHE